MDKAVMKVSDMIMDLIGEAELDGICQGDLQAMAEAKAMDIVKLIRGGK